MVPWLAGERLRKSERLSLSPSRRSEGGRNEPRPGYLHTWYVRRTPARSLLPFPPGGCVQRRDRGEKKKDILFCDPSLSQSSSAPPSFLSELLDTHESALLSIGPSFLLPRSLHHHHPVVGRACQSRGFGYLVCLRVRPPPSKHGRRAVRAPIPCQMPKG